MTTRARRLLSIALLSGLAVTVPAATPAQDLLTLPPGPESGRLSAATLSLVRAWFDANPGGAAQMPTAMQAAIVQAMPVQFQTACARLMSDWGAHRLRDAAAWQVRVLDRQKTTGWLSLTCASRSADADLARYRDERLVRLRLDDGQIDLPALTVDDESRDGVRRINAAGHWSLPGRSGTAFTIDFDDNPCCDGPESRTQTRTVVYIETPAGVREVLSIVTARENTSHSDEPEVDVETKYQAHLIFDRDASETVTGVHATFRDRVIETTWQGSKSSARTTRDRTGTLRYRWNAATLSFEPVK